MKLFGSNKHLAAQNRLAALDIVLNNSSLIMNQPTPTFENEKKSFLKYAQEIADKILLWAYQSHNTD